MTRDSGPLAVYVISHTHWDREWYHPAARFRQRLVRLIDEVLAAPDDAPFLLDGQAVILEDYLTVRPDARAAVGRALQSGRLEAGPWYVLADELVPGGEALVRNLLTGRRILRGLDGAQPPPVLYSPDAFGHPAILPMLAAEFGFGLAIVWRGAGGAGSPDGDVFRWRAPDDTSVVAYHLPPDGYEFGASLPTSDADARARWRELSTTMLPRVRLGTMLLFNGADHHAPQLDLAAAVAALARAAAPAVVRRTGLRAAAEALVRRAATAELPEIAGELRDSTGYTWSLQGTFAIRAPLKARAVRLEREMLRDVEPWLALARLENGVPIPQLEHAAWSALLRCYPHDTICGCSIDAVARAMRARLESAEAQAAGLRGDALHALVGHDPDAACGRRDAWRPAVIVRNRAPRARGGIAELELSSFVRDVPVGPGSAFADTASAPDETVRLAGGAIPYQLLDERTRYDRLEPRRHYPDNDLVRSRQIVAWLPAVPALGLTAIPIDGGEPPVAAGGVRGGVEAGDRPWIENELLRLCVDGDGSLSLSSIANGSMLREVIELEDVGDAGDTYTPSLMPPVVRTSTPRSVRLVHRGPLRAVMDAEFELAVPDRSDRTGRSARTMSLVVTVSMVLDAGARFIRFRVRGVNEAADHRVRVILATGVDGGDVWADAAFGPIRRTIADAMPDDTSRERRLALSPLHRYVTRAGAAGGATVFADGPTEYEPLSDGRIAVTLFRAVGELSRSDLPERPGHAGWPAPTPEAQCLGPFEAELALFLHGARTDAVIDEIERTADDVLVPLVGETIRALLAPPPAIEGFALEGAGLAYGACKRAEKGDWVVLRCVNLLEHPVNGAWRVRDAIREARSSRLDETPGDPIPIRNGAVAFDARPRGVVTILVR